MRTSLIAMAAFGLMTATAYAAAPTAEEKAALFDEADADGSGSLNLAEFNGLRALVEAKMAEKRFAAADSDASGEVSAEEFQALRPGRGGGGRFGR